MNPNIVLDRIKNRDHLVFKKLFEDFYGQLVHYAHGYLFDTGSSEDVVQEVFVQLWENTEGIEIKSTLKAYLYAMVRNRCLNVLKSVKITDTAKVLEFRTTHIHLREDIHPIINEEQDNKYHQALQTIDELPLKMRAVVKLRFINNYRYAEIADELGISINTVKTHLKRAKLKFSELTLVVITFLFILK